MLAGPLAPLLLLSSRSRTILTEQPRSQAAASASFPAPPPLRPSLWDFMCPQQVCMGQWRAVPCRETGRWMDMDRPAFVADAVEESAPFLSLVATVKGANSSAFFLSLRLAGMLPSHLLGVHRARWAAAVALLRQANGLGPNGDIHSGARRSPREPSNALATSTTVWVAQ